MVASVVSGNSVSPRFYIKRLIHVKQLLFSSKSLVLFEPLTSLIISFDLNSTCLNFCLSKAKTYIVPLSSKRYFLFNLSLSLCFNYIFSLPTSSIVLRYFLQVPMFLLILLLQNGSLVFFLSSILAFPFSLL